MVEFLFVRKQMFDMPLVLDSAEIYSQNLAGKVFLYVIPNGICGESQGFPFYQIYVIHILPDAKEFFFINILFL